MVHYIYAHTDTHTYICTVCVSQLLIYTAGIVGLLCFHINFIPFSFYVGGRMAKNYCNYFVLHQAPEQQLLVRNHPNTCRYLYL